MFRTTKLDLLYTIAKVIQKHGKNYSFATNQLYLDNLSKYHKIKITMRTLQKHMQDLREEGFIKSIRRYGHQPDGKIFRRSSAVCLTVKGYLRLAKNGWTWAYNVANKLGKRFIPGWKCMVAGKHSKPEELANAQLARTTEKDRTNSDHPLPDLEREPGTLDKYITGARRAGMTLHDYLLKSPQPQRPLNNCVKVVPDQA